MGLFDPQILRNACTPESFRRGKQYVDDRAVEDVWIARGKNGQLNVGGTVYGGYKYFTSLEISPDGTEVVNYECDCPYSQSGACKHVVALGLVASRRSAVKEEAADASAKSPTDPGLIEALRDYARKRGTPMDDKDLAKFAGQLDGLLVRRGAPVMAGAKKTKPELYELDHITFSFSYNKARDIIRVDATAKYGPLLYPLDGFELLQGDDSMAHAVRDWSAERRADMTVRGSGFAVGDRAGTFHLPGAQAFEFLRNGLPELAEQYHIEIDKAFETLATIKKSSATSDWSFGEGGEDWFAFSVSWAAGGRELTPLEIERLATGLDTHIRADDGTFIEIENRDAVQRILNAAREGRLSKPGGKLGVSLARAWELARLVEETEGARMEQTENAVSEFLRSAKTGTLVTPPTIPSALEKILRPYQREAVAWALFLRRYRFGGVLADDMGLGKTLQALSIISTERPKGAGPSLVVCPKTLVSTWVSEAARFTPGLRVAAIEGTVASRAKVLQQHAHEYDLLVTSYSMFQRDVKQYQGIDLFYAILDEAQYVKNSRTTTARAVKTLQPKHRLALTGTPLENGVHELWSLFDFLMPGLLGDHASFRFTFERPIREFGDAESLAGLKRRVQPFLLRRTKESVAPELPPRVEQTDWCPLTEVQAALYADVLASARADVYDAVERKGFERSRIDILAALTRLRQVCDHPVLVDKRLDRGEEASGKMAYTLELVREAVEGGHKVLLFSQFTSMLDLLREGLDKMGVGHVTIEGKTRDRAAAVKRFREDPSVPIFLLSLRAAGTGLTLTEADTVILYDPWWNPMVERQAMDRAHRIGQTKSVNVHKLITKGTVEERVLSLQAKKKAVFDAVVSESAEGLKGLTWDDVRELFG